MLETEKEDFLIFFKEQINKLSNFMQNDSQMSLGGFETINLKNPNVKNVLLKIISSIRDIKKKENNFYDELLVELPILEVFSEEVKDLNKLIKYIDSVVVSTSLEDNIKHVKNLISSSDIYYFINKKTDPKVLEEKINKYGGSLFLSDYIGSVWKQAKQEELLGLIIYVNSGKANKDYAEYLASNDSGKNKEEFLYKKFKESFQDLIVKESVDGSMIVEKRNKTNSRKVAPANYLDHGVIIDYEKKEIHIGFATSEYDTRGQQKQFFKKRKILKENFKTSEEFSGFSIKTVYITNSLINEAQTDGHKEHQKPFLNSFTKQLTQKEKNAINCAGLISIMGNLSSVDRLDGLMIEDFLEITPYVSGANTKKLEDDFKKIMEKGDVSYFRNYLINSAIELMSIFEKLPNNNHKMLETHAKLLAHTENIFRASVDGFTKQFDSKKDFIEPGFVKKVNEFAKLYEHIHINKFAGAMPNTNDLMTSNIYDNFSMRSRAEEYLDKLYERFHHVKNKREDNVYMKDDEISDYQKRKLNRVYTLLESLPPLAISTDRMLTVIQDIRFLKNKFPNRDVKVLLRSEHACKESHNFMKNYRKWSKEERFLDKKALSDVIFFNIDNYDRMISELKELKSCIEEPSFPKVDESQNKKKMMKK